MIKHTPTPWYWDAQVWDYNHNQDSPWLVSETEGRPVILRVDGENRIHITKENALFIEKAVNNYDNLLEALKIAYKEYGRAPDDPDALPIADLRYVMETAIAKAESL